MLIPDSDRAISEDQNYRETVRGVRAFMGWTHIPDLEYSPASRTDNPWVGHPNQEKFLFCFLQKIGCVGSWRT